MTTLDELNDTYARLHTAKEDAFWTANMGLAEDADAAQTEFDRLEIELQRFLQDPRNLARVRAALAHADLPEEDAIGLGGWERTFAAHVIETEEARQLAEEIIHAEGALARARAEMNLGYEDPEGGFVPASSVELAVLLTSEPDAGRRRAAWNGLRSIERHVLDHGFTDVVRLRNRLGRMLGGEDYYDWKVRRVEGMGKAEIFALLDDLAARTEDRARRSLEELRAEHGDAVTPWNLRYLTAGDVTRERDPYFPFGKAIDRWGRSFAALGIRFDGARLVLDLVDRKGKHENGFMHGPEVAWRRRGERLPARIHFSANAIPGMVGSGHRATNTLFHEGGHAAHFANIDMPAPCFGQEFAPTSVAFAEVQSMFLDSLLGDADWQIRYARDAAGEPIPVELIERSIRAIQPTAALMTRAMLAICCGEKAIYEIPDDELTADRVLETLRDVERRMVFLDDGAHRPVLSVPHLLSGDASAYYHGYLLALLGVHQTRAFFLERDGHLTDNPRIGPDLREAYWRPGNSRSFADFLSRLTGRPLSADAYASHLDRTVDEALAEATGRIASLEGRPQHDGPVDLEATIRIAHGNETVAELAGGDFGPFAEAFDRWVETQAAGRV